MYARTGKIPGPVPWVAAAAGAGVFSFSLVEYAVYRFILHRRFPDGAGLRRVLHKAFDHLHVERHLQPWDSNHDGGTLKQTLLPALSVMGLALGTGPFAVGPFFWAAVLTSYVVEEWIRHALPGTEINLGLSSPLWDFELGTGFRNGPHSKGSVWTRAVPRISGLLLLCMLPARAADDPGGGSCVVTGPDECLRVTEAGEGPAVVLIPGLFGSAFGFRQVMPLLTAQGYRAIVVEPLGVGDSSRPRKADYSLTAQADRIGRVLESLGVSHALLVAHSISTSMALRLAYRDPARIRGVVALEGGPAEEVTTPGFRRSMKLAPLLKLLGAGRILRGRVRAMLKSRSGDSAWVTDEIVARYSEGAVRDLDATLDAFAQMARAREPEALGPRLREISCPVRLVLGGARHQGSPSEAERETLESELASFATIHIPGAGNFIFEEAPEAVVAAVVDVDRSSSIRAPKTGDLRVPSWP